VIPRVYFVDADRPFLAELAHAWLDEAARDERDPADGVLFLPTRRAARAAAAAFLDARGGPLIMPRIAAIGAADEAALGILAGLDLPPAIAAEERRAILAQLILGMGGRDGAPTTLAAALLLADDLALLLDTAAQAEIDLADTLPGIVAPDLAEHWQRTLDFLSIVTEAWLAILAERGAVDPAVRQRMLLDAQGERWHLVPPAHPVWLAGLAAAPPALARLARIVAGLPRGCVILPGFDPDLPDDAWSMLDRTPTHPQAGFRRLTEAIGVRREEVAPLRGSGTTRRIERVALLRRAFLPLSPKPDGSVISADGMWQLDAADEQDEARAIALTLRHALETPGRDAALVTSDRGLAQRVAAELERLGIRAEDSAGERLADTPPAVLLRLLAVAAASDYDAVPLLALLKHPLVNVGLPAGRCRALARRLDLMLRAALPGPGFAAMRHAADHATKPDEALSSFLADLQVRLRPLSLGPAKAPPTSVLAGLVAAAEAIAEDLWIGEAGAALSEHLAVQIAALEALPDVEPTELVPLLDAVLGNARLRRPRARDANPRVAIWGMMEARLQRVDTLVLGGLVEGVFPAEPDPGPWLSRPMRRAARLPDDAERIGEAAHDLGILIAACDEVVLSAPRRRGRAPAVPSRFLARIDLALRGTGSALPPHPAAHWAAGLDQPSQRISRPRPEPRPPAHARPTSYSISKIAILLADPYAIYASEILRLRPLNALQAETDAALFGTITHDALRTVARIPDWASAPDAAGRLAHAFATQLRSKRLRRALEAFWLVRLERIADWIVEIERARLVDPGTADEIRVELPGEWRFDRFTVNGRADRIERRGGALAIIDYKTGSPPADKAVEAGSAPQLPIEAVIAEAGGFPGFTGKVIELAYWKLSGGATEGETRALFGGKPDQLAAVIEAARTQIPALLAHYAESATPFLDAPHPGRKPYDQPFAGVSRRAEWQEDA
jgi:ATP-dependent helicase/nuclease subunit B